MASAGMRLLRYLYLILFAFANLSAFCEDTDAINMLKKTKKSFDSLRSYQWNLLASIQTSTGTVRINRICRQNNARFEALDLPDGFKSEKDYITCFIIINGKRLMQYEKNSNLILVTEMSNRLNFIQYFGGELDGYIGDYGIIHEILLEFPETVKIAGDKEMIFGEACVKIQSSNRFGEFSIWIDPAAGYRYRKYEVHKKAGNLAGVSRLGKDGHNNIRSVSISCNNIELRKFNDTYVPVSGIARRIIVYDNASSDSIVASIERRDIVINPEFDKTNAFKADFPDGADVIWSDHGLRMKWAQGDMVHALNQKQLEKIKSDLALIVSDAPGKYVGEVSRIGAQRILYASLGILLIALGLVGGIIMRRKGVI